MRPQEASRSNMEHAFFTPHRTLRRFYVLQGLCLAFTVREKKLEQVRSKAIGFS
ncbi:hypothetical protein RUA4292_01510 [Ruegeria atlantica]|uniref:Uncharacterized protein n=1 Tax=Ruegeria atlantica TaxID=81569 RepID=A0A0P1EDG8_9RHOB|nr:hypothetical protein RUA4292_01510 [Ruegeria atlantica]